MACPRILYACLLSKSPSIDRSTESHPPLGAPSRLAKRTASIAHTIQPTCTRRCEVSSCPLSSGTSVLTLPKDEQVQKRLNKSPPLKSLGSSMRAVICGEHPQQRNHYNTTALHMQRQRIEQMYIYKFTTQYYLPNTT
jgi:hypothetical protein